MITHLDHVYTYLRNNDLDVELARAERAGFLLLPNKVRHPAGHLNAFIEMTGSYLEFISVVDEAEFERDATPEDREFRQEPGPYAAGAVCLEPERVFEKLSPLFPDMKPPYSRGETGKPEPIRWTFCPLPPSADLGCEVFPLKYHSRVGKAYEPKVGKNSIYDVTGLVLCSDEIRAKMDQWERALAPVTFSFRRNANEIRFGAQAFSWISRAEYSDRFGANWIERRSPWGDIAAIKLGAVSVDLARSMLEAEGFKSSENRGAGGDFVRDLNTGNAFALEEGDPNAFLEGLNALS